MADLPKPIGEPISTPLPSQSELLSDVRLRRRLFMIPGEQKILLDTPGSWAECLSRKQWPGVNVPPVVLENLRQLHRAQVQFTNLHVSQTPVKGARNSVAKDQLVSINELSSHRARSTQDDEEDVEVEDKEERVEDKEEDEDEDEDEDGGTPISGWSVSPEQQRQIDIVQAISPGQRFISQSPEPERDSGPMPPFISQLPASSPLRPTLAASYLQSQVAFDDIPPSSLEIEEELEVVTPAAFTEQIPAVNKAAEPMATPPSAQVQVPSTFYDPNSSVGDREPQPQAQAQPKKREGYPTVDAVFKRAAKLRATANMQSVSTNRMAPPQPALRVGVWDSQSTVHSSSSVIPATNIGHPSPLKHPDQLQMNSLVPRSPAIIPATITTNHLPPRRSPEYKPASPGPGSTHPSPENLPLSSQVRPPTPLISGPEPTDPFGAYSISYPSYTGSAGDFVKACINIEILQRKRALASYQYDDFIREWVQGYLPYIESLDGSESRILTAIEWYMETVQDRLFSANIITKQNLNSVLASYPSEVELAQSSLENLPEESADLVVGHGIQQEVECQVAKFRDERSAILQNTAEYLPTSRNVDESRETELFEALPPSLKLDGNRTSPAHVTPSLDERPVLARPSSTPTTSKSFSRKRPVDEDLSSRTSKRPASGSIAPSNTATSRSTGSTHRANPKKKDEDLEKRSRRLKKFLAKDKSRRSTSITSSALAAATPTSGQKD